MCGRFVSSSPPDEIARYFDAEGVAPDLGANYNVAPTTDVFVVYTDGDTRKVDAFHWGLVPFWAKDPSVGNRMINARAEGIESKNSYRHAFRKQRCLIPADGFYEWEKVKGQKAKQPWFAHRPDAESLAFAGLWEEWHPKDQPGVTLRSCTIITTEANPTMADIHDRMPVILPPSAWDQWLDPGERDPAALNPLLVPAPPKLITLRKVSTEVNNVRNRGAHLIEQIDEEGSAPSDGGGETADGDAGQGTLL